MLNLISSDVHLCSDIYQAKLQYMSSIQYHIDWGATSKFGSTHTHTQRSLIWTKCCMNAARSERDPCVGIRFLLSDYGRPCDSPQQTPPARPNQSQVASPSPLQGSQ